MEYEIKELDNIKLLTIKYKTQNLEPLIELYRGKLYSKLIKFFINDCVEQLGYEIFSIKKSYSRTITNLLSSWIFSLYIDNVQDNTEFFFPSNYEKTSSLKDTLNDFCKYKTNIINKNEKIDIIINRLIDNYRKNLELLTFYKSSSQFLNNKNNYKIKKNLISIKKNDSYSNYYKFDIFIEYQIKDKKIDNILKNIILPNKIYNKLVLNYTGPKNKIDEYLWSILFRYQLLSSNNHQLGVLPKILSQMNQDYNLNFECFASSINATFKNYCSIYYDLEKYFGSIGSFFNIIPIKGTFGINPPYQKDIINSTINKLFKFLNDSKDFLTFIITIPIWDLDGKKFMKDNFNNELEKQNIDYGEFQIINDVKHSIFFKGLRMIEKEKFTYIDHNYELYKNKTIQNTYVIILSNQNINFELVNKYNFNI